MWKNNAKLRGVCRIYDAKTGELLRQVRNLIVNSGLSFLAAQLSGGNPTDMSYTAVGSGSTAPAAGNTALEAQIGARMSATITAPSSTSVRFASTSSAGSHTGNWYEAGIFNAATAGTMLCRVTFGLLTKGANDVFTVEYTISFSDDGV
jgi:hypothetical protein